MKPWVENVTINGNVLHLKRWNKYRDLSRGSPETSDDIHVTFVTEHSFNSSIIVVVHLLLRLIYKLSFVVDMYIQEKYIWTWSWGHLLFRASAEDLGAYPLQMRGVLYLLGDVRTAGALSVRVIFHGTNSLLPCPEASSFHLYQVLPRISIICLYSLEPPLCPTWAHVDAARDRPLTVTPCTRLVITPLALRPARL